MSLKTSIATSIKKISGSVTIIIQILMVAAILAILSSVGRSWNNLHRMQIAAVVGAAILTFGAALEYKVKFEALAPLIAKWILGVSTPFERCVLKKIMLTSVAPILVVIGLGAEIVFEGRTFVLENTQQEQDESTLGSLQDRETSLTGQITRASDELKNIEFEIFTRRPRSDLLAKNAPELIARLKSFPDQRVKLTMCGMPDSQDSETLDTWEILAKELGPKGAKWKLENEGIRYFKGCGPLDGPGEGIQVFVSGTATAPTPSAAKALSKELIDSLPPSKRNTLEVVSVAERKDRPEAFVLSDPKLILVLVGAHP